MSEGGTRGKQIAAADVMLAPLPMAFGNGLGRPPCRSGSAADAIRQGDHDKVTQGLPMVYHYLGLADTDTARDVRAALTVWHRQAPIVRNGRWNSWPTACRKPSWQSMQTTRPICRSHSNRVLGEPLCPAAMPGIARPGLSRQRGS